MSPRHHPGEETLQAYTSRTLGGGASLVVSVHVEACPHCQATMRFLDTVGGLLMATLDPKPMAPGALNSALSALGNRGADPPESPASDLVEGLRPGPWQAFGPGLQVALLEGAFAPDELVALLKAQAGARIPEHGHEGFERFVILEGGFGIADTVYRRRDYVEADSSVIHAPYIPADRDCLCLVALQGRLAFIDPADGLPGL